MNQTPNQPASKALTVSRDYDDMASQALAFAQSGLFPTVKTQSQAVVKMLAGRELGFGPWASMANVHIITTNKGTSIQIGSKLLAAAVLRHPRYDYRILEHDNEKCEIQFYVDGEARTPTSIFTIADARLQGLVKDGSNWKKIPRNMVFARAMSNGVTWHCPDVVGGMPVYTEGDEIEDEIEIRASGRVADLEPDEILVEAEVVDPGPAPEPATPAEPSAPPASQGQQATIAGILATTDIDEAKVQTQLTAMGIEDPANFTEAEAESFINWLQAQVGAAVAS